MPPEAEAKQLGRAVRAWREAHGQTQRQLAARLGWTQSTLARLEGGGVAPTLTTLTALAAALSVRITVTPGTDGSTVTLIELAEVATDAA